MARIKSYLKNTHPQLEAEWDGEKNERAFSSYATNSHDLVWWICPKKHSYEAMISNRAKGRGCSYCSGKKVLPGFNDLKSQRPDLAEEWDESNAIGPEEVHSGSHFKAVWKCRREHTWKASVSNRNSIHNKNGCPVCSGNVLLAGFNDLFTLRPHLKEKWDFEKNTIDPTKVRIDDKQSLWWRCSHCEKSWQRRPGVENRRRTTLCSSCLKGSSIFEQEVFTWLEETFPEEKLIFNSKSIISPYELDVYFPEKKIAIELNGDYWHGPYNLKKRGFRSEIEYHERKLRLTEELDVTLAFLWHGDWETKQEHYKNLIEEFLRTGVAQEALLRTKSEHRYEKHKTTPAMDVLQEWTTSKGVEVVSTSSSLGDVFTLDNKISIILSPKATSSKELREMQEKFLERGIKLFYYFPWEDLFKFLAHTEGKLGLQNKVYAAKRLDIKVIENKLADDFIAEHHLQGSTGGKQKVSIALMHQEEVLAVQQYAKYRFSGKIINEGTVWEGLRLCFKTGVRIHGAASRMQKYFIQNYKPKEIMSYVSLSHSEGNFKTHQGFEEIKGEKNSYMWVLEDCKPLSIKDKFGALREADLEKVRRTPFLNPNRVAGAFGAGVGKLFFGGSLGSKKDLSAHRENGENTHNDAILEALGYRKVYTPGQSKWILTVRD